MSGATPEKIARLPAWAQEHIRILTMRLDEEHRRRETLAQGTLVSYGYYIGASRPRGFMDDNDEVRFEFPDMGGAFIGAKMLTPLHDERHIRISTGGDRLIIAPEASNGCRLTVRR